MFDDDGGATNADFVDAFFIDIDIQPGSDYTNRTTYRGFYGIGELDLSFQVMCLENFYGPDCATECIPMDSNVTGHFTCNSDGSRVCLTGYAAPACLEAEQEQATTESRGTYTQHTAPQRLHTYNNITIII